MVRSLSATEERFPLAAAFTISRGSKTEAAVITCTISQDGHSGRGECVPYTRYGETVESVREDIEAMRGKIAGGLSRQELLVAMKPGAARNAIDCALWDLEAKASGISTASRLGWAAPRPLETAFTISLDAPEAMAAQTRLHAGRCSRSRWGRLTTSAASRRWRRQLRKAASSLTPMRAGAMTISPAISMSPPAAASR